MVHVDDTVCANWKYSVIKEIVQHKSKQVNVVFSCNVKSKNYTPGFLQDQSLEVSYGSEDLSCYEYCFWTNWVAEIRSRED